MPATDLPDPPTLQRADERIVRIDVRVLGDSLSLAAVVLADLIPMASPYVLAPAEGEHADVYVADIGHATLDQQGRVRLSNTLEPPPLEDSSRTLLLVSGPAAYHAMGVSAWLAQREGVEHPSVCVLPDRATDADMRTLIAIHVLALYKRLHSV